MTRGDAVHGALAEAGPDQAGKNRRSGDGTEPGGRRVQGLVLILGEIDAGGGDVALELLHARCARYGDYGGRVNDPGQGDLGRRGGASCPAYDWPYPHSREPNCQVPSPIREILVVAGSVAVLR